MGERRTSVFENGLIWFGAAVSIAEILTGAYLTSNEVKTGKSNSKCGKCKKRK